MSRIIFVPQYPTHLRYQETWFTEFPKEFKKYFTDVVTLCGNAFFQEEIQYKNQPLFSPVNDAIHFEISQIREFLNLDLREDDTLFLADLSFPGFFSNVLYHKPIKNAYAYCHATSLNRGDYFQPVRYSKYPCEVAHSKLFKKIFIGSEYHKRKLNWNNTKVVGLPVPPYPVFFDEEKKYEIISVARPNKQKITKWIEKNVEREFCKIERGEFKEWVNYYQFLSRGKILLITGKEDTFNYSIMESIMNKTVVLAPNRCAYPELLSKDYLYNNWDELRVKIWNCLKGEIEPPKKLLNQKLCDNFYENIIGEMKNE